MAEKTGISVEALSALRYAGESVGTTQEQMSAGLTKLTKLMGAAAGGNDQAASTFKQLGVEIQNADGSMRGTDQVLADLSQRFSGWEDGPAKAAAAMKVFGKSGEDMIPMLNLGTAGLQSMASEAAKLGAVFGADAAKNAADFNDHLTKIKLASEAAAVSLSGPLVKALADVSGAFIEAKKSGEGYFGMLARSASLMPKLPTMMDGLPMVRMFRLMQQAGDTLKAPKSNEQIQTYVNKFGSSGGAGRGTVNPRTAAPLVEDKTGNKPTIPKAPDHFADNFINQLITEYANLSGEMSKTEEVTRKLDTATEKFTVTQREEILGWAKLIDQRKIAVDLKTFADSTKLETDALELQANMRGRDSSAIQQAVEILKIKADIEERILKIKKSSIDESLKEDAISKLRITGTQLENNVRTKTAESIAAEIKTYVDSTQLETNVLELQANMRGMATSEQQKAIAVYRIQADLQSKIKRIQESAATQSEKDIQISKLRTASLQEESNAMGEAANGYADYLSSMGTEAERMASVVSGGFKSMEDAIVSFTKTGKLDFSAMADSIISDLVRIAIQQSITRPLAQAIGLFGFANGGIMSSSGALPLNAYASGGIASGPQIALFGEGRMNEAYVPLPDGKSIPVSLQGGGGGGSITINQPLVLNAPNAGPETIARIQAMMPGMIAANARVVEGVVKQAMRRGGGRLSI
jgi:lambda family phage tail tape measure protein